MSKQRTEPTPTETLDKVIQIDQAQIQAHLSEMVRGSAEETVNAMLDSNERRSRDSPTPQDNRNFS